MGKIRGKKGHVATADAFFMEIRSRCVMQSIERGIDEKSSQPRGARSNWMELGTVPVRRGFNCGEPMSANCRLFE